MPAPAEERFDELLAAMRAHDPRALARFFDRFEALVNRLVWRILGASAAHDDVVQSAFELMVRRISDVREPAALPGWVRTITVNAARGELRARRWRALVHRSTDEDRALEHPDLDVPDDARREKMRLVARALDSLSTEDRLAVVLRHVEELELTEVAESLGCSLATVKRRLSRIEARLAALLEDLA